MGKERCYLCAKRNNGSIAFDNIEMVTVPASNKPIRIVLQHLANCIKKKLDFPRDACICPNCLKELSEYDGLMLKLLTFQKKLTKMLTESMNNKTYAIRNGSEKMVTDEVVDILDNDDDHNDTDTLEDSEDDDEEISEEKPTRNIRECTVCNKLFKNQLQLTEHTIKEHDSPRVFACHICGTVRRDEEYLELHMNVHEGKTENECRYCPKRFSRPVSTLRHMRKHWNKKKYQCERCGVCFSQDNLLYNHKMLHDAEENPLICSVCNQSFKTKKTYNHHMQIHQENRKRHQCEFCSKSFTERYTLKMHLKTHPESEPKLPQISADDIKSEILAVDAALEASCSSIMRCVICGINYESADSLNEHLEKEHDVILK